MLFSSPVLVLWKSVSFLSPPFQQPVFYFTTWRGPYLQAHLSPVILTVRYRYLTHYHFFTLFNVHSLLTFYISTLAPSTRPFFPFTLHRPGWCPLHSLIDWKTCCSGLTKSFHPVCIISEQTVYTVLSLKIFVCRNWNFWLQNGIFNEHMNHTGASAAPSNRIRSLS